MKCSSISFTVSDETLHNRCAVTPRSFCSNRRIEKNRLFYSRSTAPAAVMLIIVARVTLANRGTRVARVIRVTRLTLWLGWLCWLGWLGCPGSLGVYWGSSTKRRMQQKVLFVLWCWLKGIWKVRGTIIRIEWAGFNYFSVTGNVRTTLSDFLIRTCLQFLFYSWTPPPPPTPPPPQFPKPWQKQQTQDKNYWDNVETKRSHVFAIKP